MHIITNTAPLPAGRQVLPPGRWLVDNVNAGQWLARHSSIVRVEAATLTGGRPEEATGDRRQATGGGPEEATGDRRQATGGRPRKILFVRPGGLGDLVMATPIWREMHAEGVRHQAEGDRGLEIWICTQPHNGVVLDGLPYIAGQLPYPLPADEIPHWDAIIPFEDVVECHPEHKSRHALDLLAERTGVPRPVDCRPDYRIHVDEFEEAKTRWPKGERRRVAVQIAASHPSRSYPRMGELIDRLVHQGWQVVAMGDPRTQRLEHPFGAERVLNLMKAEPAPTFRQSVALLAQCDGAIAPDSALVHVGGALGVPCVGLYGPFPWQLRTAYYPSVHGLNGAGLCAGCCFHARESMWPKNKPCERTGQCEVLAAIEPARVLRLLEKQIEKAEGKKPGVRRQATEAEPAAAAEGAER